MREYWTLGDIADAYSVQLHRVQRLAMSGRIPVLPNRIGRLRVVRHEDIPQVEEALTNAGYIRATPQGAAQ